MWVVHAWRRFQWVAGWDWDARHRLEEMRTCTAGDVLRNNSILKSAWEEVVAHSALPHHVRNRIRRFGWVELPGNQAWKAKRVEVSVGKQRFFCFPITDRNLRRIHGSPACQFPHSSLTAEQSFRRNAPFHFHSSPEAKAQKLPLLRSRHRALRLIPLELEPSPKESCHALQDASPRPLAS